MSVENWHRLIWIDDWEDVEVARKTYQDKYLYFPSWRQFLDNQVNQEIDEMWNKKYIEGTEDYTYFCGCGAEMGELFYNADTGHYECYNCGSESPDLEMIPVVD